MKRRYLFPIFVLMPLTACSLGNINYVRAITQTEDVTVKIGDVINVEPRTLIYEGQSKTVNGQIFLPDGTSQSGKSFTITQPGVYQVLYRAFFGVEEVSQSVYYHCHRQSGDLFVSSNPSNKAVNGLFSYSEKTNKIQGAKLKLDTNTVFTYDGVIDFNTFDPNESFIRFIVDTSKQGESDLESFIVRLTDIEDPSNYIEMMVSDSGILNDAGQGCYVLAGSNNQTKTGYENFRPDRRNEPEYMPFFNVWGANVGTSFRALNNDFNPGRTAEFYLDYAEKELYAYPMYNQWNKNMITDLNDPKVYGSMVWEGFSTGKATVSIMAGSLKSASADIIITKIADYDLSQLIFEDHTAPIINIDYENQSPNNLPKASVGVPYKLFNASVSDNFDRDLPYEVSVTYYDEAYDKVKDVSVIGNFFTPLYPGTYEITYSARDYSNNVATETITVTAVNSAQTMSMQLPTESITHDIYDNFELPSINDVIINGGSGKAKVTRTIVDSNQEEIVILGDTFVPTEVGTYYVYYDATDYIGNTAQAVLTLIATNPGRPIFVGDVVLPRVVMKGHTYTLPSYNGVEVVSGQTVNLVSQIYVNGELIQGNFFDADGNDGYCHIKYKLAGQSGENEFSESIQLIESGDPINQANYFVGDFTATEQQTYVNLNTSSNATSLFSSILPYDNPSVKFALPSKSCEELVFKFSDSQDKELALTFHVTFEGDKNYISLGNSEDKYEFASENDTLGEAFSITFDNSSKILTDIAQTELTRIKSFDNGEEFTGFTHGLYLEISMNGVSSSTDLRMMKIANQNLGYRTDHKDHTQPYVLLNGNFYGSQDYGTMAVIPTVDVFDVLSNASVTITVRDPKSHYVIQNEDARVPHTFELNSFGNYVVIYQATDAANNRTTYRRTIRVYDTIPPEITINGSLKSSYSLNAKISIPDYTVTDNLNNYTLDVFLILPNDEERLLIVDENGEVTSYLEKDDPIYNASFKVNATTFRAEQYGQYILRFVAYDSDFNKTVVELTFVVK